MQILRNITAKNIKREPIEKSSFGINTVLKKPGSSYLRTPDKSVCDHSLAAEERVLEKVAQMSCKVGDFGFLGVIAFCAYIVGCELF